MASKKLKTYLNVPLSVSGRAFCSTPLSLTLPPLSLLGITHQKDMTTFVFLLFNHFLCVASRDNAMRPAIESEAGDAVNHPSINRSTGQAYRTWLSSHPLFASAYQSLRLVDAWALLGSFELAFLNHRRRRRYQGKAVSRLTFEDILRPHTIETIIKQCQFAESVDYIKRMVISETCDTTTTSPRTGSRSQWSPLLLDVLSFLNSIPSSLSSEHSTRRRSFKGRSETCRGEELQFPIKIMRISIDLWSRI